MPHLENLKPFTKENAAEMGRRGGLSRSLRKQLASSIKNLKHGKYSKNEDVIRAITPTPVEKVMGIDYDAKLGNARGDPFLGAKNREQATDGMRYELASSKAQLQRWEQDQRAKGREPSPHFRMRMNELQIRFNENVWGIDNKSALVNVNVQENVITNNQFNMEIQQIMAKVKEEKRMSIKGNQSESGN